MPNSLIVVDDLKIWVPYYPSESVVSFVDYLNWKGDDASFSTRIVNLCNADRYLGHGYYCSLLAEARGHRVIPTVNTINDLKSRPLYALQLSDLREIRDVPAGSDGGTSITFKIYFGTTRQAQLRTLARRIFERVNFPILEVSLVVKKHWTLKALRAVSIEALDEDEQTEFAEALDAYSHRLWQKPRAWRPPRWEMAILVNPEEPMPPSDEKALKRLVKAGRKRALDVEFISPRDINRIGQYDALFIRETTEINHHTYRMARRAELEGLIVIDDPISILRCCNKVYLADIFRRKRIPTLRTQIIQNKDRQVISSIEKNFDYPVILKIPNGSFSRGVHKVENTADLATKLKALFQQSSLLIVQEYLYTPFDWRVGILNHKPLYANRYYMAKDHWQIYDHQQNRVRGGNFDAMPTFEVPKVVLEAALKAASAIGDGFYGVDLKQQGNAAYVIEVNDNPSLDHGVEDAYLGDELYMQIMNEFVRRLENRGR